MAAPILFPLELHEVRERWNRHIRGGVISALEHDTDGAMAEDVFASLMGGHSQLWMGFYQDDRERGGSAGFIITREMFTPQGKELLVWLAYHNGGDEATTADFMPQVAEIARQSGCFRVAIESPRPYHRAVPGMKLARHVFHYEV
jgi:hypothetical protein